MELATAAHAGQFRHDKKTPYIEHPKAVAEIALKLVEHSFVYDDLKTEVAVVSYLHDVAEDVEQWKNSEDQLIEYLETLCSQKLPYGYMAIDALAKLNKHRHESYSKFIQACCLNPLSLAVKRADLMHNLSDLAKGSLRDKYELALCIMERNKI